MKAVITQKTILKVLRTVLYSLLMLAGLVAIAVLMLTGTEGGTSLLIRTAIDNVQKDTSMRIAVGDINGTFFSDIEFSQFNVRDTATGFRLNAESLSLSLNTLALFNRLLHISRVDARGLVLTLPTENTDQESDPVQQLESLFSLPLAVQIDALAIAPFTLTGEQPQTLQSITGSLQLDRMQLRLSARLTQDDNTWIAPDITLDAGSYNLTGAMPWQAAPGDRPAGGELTVSGDIFALDIQHKLTAPLLVTSTGALVSGLRAGTEFGFDLRHQASNVGGATVNMPELQDISGTVTTAGTPARITIGGDVDVRVNTLGNTVTRFTVVYENESLAIEEVSLRNERFSLDASGTADIGDGLALNLAWQLADFSDGDLWPQVTLEEVNGSGAVTINTAGDDTVIELSLETLTGMLNGYPLTGNGEIAIVGGTVNDVALTLVSDVNSLLLEGSVTPQLDLDWSLQAPALAQLLSGLTGEIIGNGTLTGTTEAPQVAGTLDATGLSWNNGDTAFQLDTLSANVSYDDSNANAGSNAVNLPFTNVSGQVAGTLDAAGLSWNNGDAAFQAGTLTANVSYDGNNANAGSNAVNLAFTDVSGQVAGRELVQDSGLLELTGILDDHAFSLSTRGPELSLMLDGEGGYGSQAWNGTLATASISSPFGDWQLQDPLPLTLSPDQANISNHCWLMQGIMLCGQAVWTETTGLAGDLAIDNIPLAYFNDNLPDGVPGTEAIREQLAGRPPGLVNSMLAWRIAMPANGLVDGMLDLTMTFNGLGPDWRQASLSAELVPRDLSLGILRRPAEDAVTNDIQVERYGIDEVALTVERMAGRWLMQSSFEIYLSEAGGLDFQGAFNGNFQLADDDMLGGDFELTFNNIAWVEALAPKLSQVRGELGASGNISGSLQNPVLNMDASVDNGAFRLPEFGLTLDDVGLELHSANNNEITITGMASSGAGSISFDSLLTMPLQESRTLHLEVRGDNFELMNTDEIHMVVVPDLVLDFRNRIMNVSGSLDVPQMNIDFSERQALSASGLVDVSRDVVIVAGDDNQRPAGSADLSESIPMAGEVRLGMGDDVSFLGYGLDLELTGNLMLEQSVDRPLLAHGELSIPVGSYALYGQRLTINDGKLLFLGNPLNPALDIRAVRQTRVAEVGLLMNGTARNIQAQLFSTPSLPESEILSLLVTGNSIESGGNFGGQDGENMLGAIALLSLEKGQGLTDTVSNKLGLDTLAISSGSDYRDSALGLGKYINPNLFMRYDIGLFDRENVLTLEYILSERLRLEVESGISQSVDLTYTVEK